MYLRNLSCLISTSAEAVITGREMGAGRSLSHWIIESAVYLQPINMLILSTEFFSVLTQSGWSFALLAVYLLCMRTAWFEWTVMSHQQNKIWRSEKLQLVHWPVDLCLFVTLFVCHYCLSALLDVNRQPLDFASEFSFYLLENNNYACIMPLSQSLISCLFYSQLCSLLIGWYWAIMRRKLYELTCPITLCWGL